MGLLEGLGHKAQGLRELLIFRPVSLFDACIKQLFVILFPNIPIFHHSMCEAKTLASKDGLIFNEL